MIRTDYSRDIADVAAQIGLDADWLEAQVIIESSGKTDAFRYEPDFYRRYLENKPEWARWNARRVSSSYGLLQVMFPVAVEHGFDGEPEELFLPKTGLYWGALIMKRLLDWSGGDRTKALVAYNGGKGSAMKLPYPIAPATYAAKVTAVRDRLVTTTKSDTLRA